MAKVEKPSASARVRLLGKRGPPTRDEPTWVLLQRVKTP